MESIRMVAYSYPCSLNVTLNMRYDIKYQIRHHKTFLRKLKWHQKPGELTIAPHISYFTRER